jgi:hypothetical protein
MAMKAMKARASRRMIMKVQAKIKKMMKVKEANLGRKQKVEEPAWMMYRKAGFYFIKLM